VSGDDSCHFTYNTENRGKERAETVSLQTTAENSQRRCRRNVMW